MLQVALLGSLVDRAEALRSAPMRTEVQWLPPPRNEAETPNYDLLVRLGNDREATHQLATVQKLNPVWASVVAVWDSPPPTGELEHALQDGLTQVYGFVVGTSDAMHVACRWIRAVAHQVSCALNLRTLLVGETGTGKDLVAQAIHRLGPRRGNPFVALNCGVFPRELIASELFGHLRGAYTGAVTDREGALRRAGKGVLFLDEIGELPLDLQVQFLRVLETQAFKPVGGDRGFPFPAQVVSATNQLLDLAVSEKTFRADLFYRLAQVTIHLPPLRERPEDIPLLVRRFLHNHGVTETILDSGTLEAMQAYAWPGNIRELRSSLERFLLLWRTGQRVGLRDWLPSTAGTSPGMPSGGTLADLRNDFERRLLEAVLARHGGNTEQAARELGITRRSIYNMLHRHNLNPKASLDE